MGSGPSSLNVAESMNNVVNNNITSVMNDNRASSDATNEINLKTQGTGGIQFDTMKQTSKAYVNLDSFSQQYSSTENQNDIKNQAKQQAESESVNFFGGNKSAATNYQTQYMKVFNENLSDINNSCFGDSVAKNKIDLTSTDGKITVGYIDQNAESVQISSCVQDQTSQNASVTSLQNSVSHYSKSKSVSPLIIIIVIVIIGVALYFGAPMLMGAGEAVAGKGALKVATTQGGTTQAAAAKAAASGGGSGMTTNNLKKAKNSAKPIMMKVFWILLIIYGIMTAYKCGSALFSDMEDLTPQCLNPFS